MHNWKHLQRSRTAKLVTRLLCGVLAAVFPTSSALAVSSVTLDSAAPPAYSETASAADFATDSTVVGRNGTVRDTIVHVNEVNFPDPAFREYILELTGGSEILTHSNLDQLTAIRCPNRGITSLEGIQLLPNVFVIEADNNNLTELDLSSNPLITSVCVQSNKDLSSLNLNGCGNLTSLNICDTSVSAIDLSIIPGLTDFEFGQSPIGAIDISGTPNLQKLIYYGGSISQLDLSSLARLQQLLVSSAPVKSVDLTRNSDLESIVLRDLDLTTIQVSDNSNCTVLEAPQNQLISVHGCSSASYATLDFSNQRPCTIRVASPYGSYDLSELDPDFAKGIVTNLSRGKINGSVLSGVAPGDTVTYTYSDGGVSLNATLNVTEGNSWTEPLIIEGWTESETPNAPSARAAYGTPVYTYASEQSEIFAGTIPTTAGTWICRAEVPGTAEYGPLTTQETFSISTQAAEIPIPQNLTALYRESISRVALPAGFSWVRPSELVGDVGVQMHAATYKKNATSPAVSVKIPVTVTPRPGSDCTISPVTNEYEAHNIRITLGTYTLKEGTDYTLSYVTSGNTATITISFIGNFTGNVTRSFTFTHTNAWVVTPSIANWTAGETASLPQGAAKYGTVEFAYLVNGTYQSQEPTEPGIYTMRASVEATDSYTALSQDITFRIYRGTAPTVAALDAIYGDLLSSVQLPDSFTWLQPNQTVGNAGVNRFSAVYTPQSTNSEYAGGEVSVSVHVAPRDGSVCTISPIGNEYESRHIVIKDGNTMLTAGKDYTVSYSVDGNVAAVTIRFIGNYTGTVTRTFRCQNQNEWIEQPSISSWVAGGTPSVPSAGAMYGTVQFSYETTDGVKLNSVPSGAGQYILIATVPASGDYTALTAEVPFTVYAALAPDVADLTAVYGDTLDDVILPDGFAWTQYDTLVGSVGTHSFPAEYVPTADAKSKYMGGLVILNVVVKPKNGADLDISPVTNQSDARHIVIRDGSTVLAKGTDYKVYSRVEGNKVTVTIQFIGNYTGTVVRTFTLGTTNSWTIPPTIADWSVGETPSQPIAEAKYGRVHFIYIVNGHEQLTPPSDAGEYEVRAEVPATVYYPEISETVSFRIYEAVAPSVSDLTAVYGDTLSNISLPSGFSWIAKDTRVGNVGNRQFEAAYTSDSDEYEGGTVQLTVTVTPRNGNECTISPVTNSSEARNISITYDGQVLEKGVDYTVTSTVDGGKVIVNIRFEGNFEGTASRTFTLHGSNEWLVPLSMPDWTYGQSPSMPYAEAKYGVPRYSYLVDGAWTSVRPRTPGIYTVRAVVPATAYYSEISSEVQFTIRAAQIPDVGTLQAVYGNTLSMVELPKGFVWNDPWQSVGSVGIHHFAAMYTPEGTEFKMQTTITIRILPKDGSLCNISPVTNAVQASHIIITNGKIALREGIDYIVTKSAHDGEVTVTIRFIGNYAGTVVRVYREESESVSASPESGMNTTVPVPMPTLPAVPSIPAEASGTVPTGMPTPAADIPTSNPETPAPGTTPPVPVNTAVPGTTPAKPTASSTPMPDSAPTALPEIVVRQDIELSIIDDQGNNTLLGTALIATWEGTTASEVLGMLDFDGAEYTGGQLRLVALDMDGVVMEPSDTITTDSKVQLVRALDGATLCEIVIVVLGDTTNTGTISLTQVVRMAQAFVGNIHLTGADLLAATFTGGKEVTLTDVVQEAALFRWEMMS